MSKLKRCPFCGGEALSRGFFFVQCIKCGVSTLTYLTEIDAIKAWNTRKPMERIVDRLEKLSDIFNTGKYNDAYCKTIDDDKCEGTNCFACVLNKASEVVKEEGGMNG